MTTTTPSARLLILPGLLLSLAIGAEQRRVADLDLSVQESDITPSVTLREHENRAVEEYRVNNNLYMVKITPAAGAPYYLVDDDGSCSGAATPATARSGCPSGP